MYNNPVKQPIRGYRQVIKVKKSVKISFNSPAVLGFTAICAAAYILNIITGGMANRLIFSVYCSSLLNPLTYVRCVCHIFGHSGWSHLFSNMMYILILGPMIEEKYGTRSTVIVIAATAVITGIVNMIFFPHVMLLGASGVVFAFILLSSIACTERNAIPVTFILVAVIYIGQQVYEGLFVADNVSQLTHIIGGAVGSYFGFKFRKK